MTMVYRLTVFDQNHKILSCYFSTSRTARESFRVALARALTTFQLGTSVIIELMSFGSVFCVCMPMMQVRFAHRVCHVLRSITSYRCDNGKRCQSLRFLYTVLYGRHALTNIDANSWMLNFANNILFCKRKHRMCEKLDKHLLKRHFSSWKPDLMERYSRIFVHCLDII